MAKSSIEVFFDKMVISTSLEVFDDIRHYFETVQASVESKSQSVISTAEKLKSKGYDDEIIADILDEDAYYSNSFAKNAYAMNVVYLYSQMESLLNTGLGAIGVTRKKHFKIDALNELYSDVGIKLKQIDHFSVIDEIRLVNNCIKHNELRCFDELGKHNSFGWKAGEKIELSEKAIEFYVDEAEKFFQELKIQIDTVIDNQITREEIDIIDRACSSSNCSLTNNETAKLKSGLQKIRSL